MIRSEVFHPRLVSQKTVSKLVPRYVLLTKRLSIQDKNTFIGWRGKDSPLPSAPQAHPLYVQQAVGSVAPALVLHQQVFIFFSRRDKYHCHHLIYLSFVMLLHLFIVLLERILFLHQRIDLSLERESSLDTVSNSPHKLVPI